MATYTLTVSTSALGLGVISGARVIAARKRTKVTDIFNGQDLSRNNAATNELGVATMLLEPDDGTVYHEIKIFDLAGILVYSKIIIMPPQSVSITDLPIQDIISSSAAQAVAAAATATTKADLSTANAEQTALDAISTAADALSCSASEEASALSESNAESYKTAAQTAKTDAENARDAALIQAGVYTTEALGRAAVADGQSFKVQGSGDVAAYEYRRTNSTTSVLIASYPSTNVLTGIYRANAISSSYPIKSTNTASNTGSSQTYFEQCLKGLVDIKLYGLSSSDSYYIERIRRNASSLWGLVVKRSSDNATVAQMSAAHTEPTDTTEVVKINLLANAVAGVYGFAWIKWSEFTAGAFPSGWTLALSRNVVLPAYTSPNTMPLNAARSNQVVMPTVAGTYATVAEATRTFTWPELLICDGLANSAGRYKLATGSVVFSNNWEIAWIDLAECATYGTDTIPNTVVKKSSYFLEAGNTAQFTASPNQFPLAWSAGASRVDVNPLIRYLSGAASSAYTDGLVISVDVTNGLVDVFIRANANDNASLTYIKYRLKHVVNSITDCWTISGVWEVLRTAYESFSSGVELVATNVELLCAFQELGMPDFMGGEAHGNEVVTESPVLVVDGREVALTGSGVTWYHAKEAMYVQNTTMYRYGTALATPLITRGLILSFDSSTGDMTARQTFSHLASYTIANGYLAMLAPHRYVTYSFDNETTGSNQISGKYVDNIRCTVKDVTLRQSSPVSDDRVQQVPPVTSVKLWGTYGTECTMSVDYVSHEILRDIFYINRTSYAYNKAYIGFIGGYSGNQAVTAGTKWAMTTRWNFKSKN